MAAQNDVSAAVPPEPTLASVPAPSRRLNPPRMARPKGSLNENVFHRHHQSPTPPPQPHSPTPASSDDELLLTTPMVSEQEHADLVMTGLQYLMHDQAHDFLTMDQALEFGLQSVEHAFKTVAHDGEPVL